MINARAVASLGIGYPGRAIASLGLIADAFTPQPTFKPLSGGGRGYYWVGNLRVPIGEPNPLEVQNTEDEEIILMVLTALEFYG